MSAASWKYVLGLALLVACAGCKGSTPPADTAPTAAKSTDKLAGGPVVNATAEQIATAFSTDKAAARETYQNKVILLEGVIDKPAGAQKAGSKAAYPVLQTTPATPQLICVVPPEVQKITERLSPGQKITVKGRCDLGANPYLRIIDCELVTVGPETATPVKSTELAAEFLKDAAAAEAKYQWKQVIVEGVVKEGKSDDTLLTLEGVEPKGEKPIPVVVLKTDDEALTKVKKGDTVKIKGEVHGIPQGSRVVITPAFLVK